MNGFTPFLSLLVIIPFIGMLFALQAKSDERSRYQNIFNVSFLSVIVNLVIIFKILLDIDIDDRYYQLVESFTWVKRPLIEISFGVDLVSCILLLGIHIAFTIGLISLRSQTFNQKPLAVFSLLFLSMLNGLLISADIFSFCIFFEAMLIPLLMLIGVSKDIKKENTIFRFFIYNFIGALFFFAATLLIYDFHGKNISLQAIGEVVNQHKEYSTFIWTAVFISLISRMPVWPFHYWTSAINSNLNNPLVSIIANTVPLTAIYAFIRFLPESLPSNVSYYVVVLEIIGVVSMLFIALIGLINKDTQYKLFSYITIYYIFYLLGAFLNNENISLSIVLSIFSSLIIFSVLSLLYRHIEIEADNNGIAVQGILCQNNRISLVFSFFILASIGLPISSLFLSNFLILSSLMSYNLNLGIVAMISFIIISSMFLREFYKLKGTSGLDDKKACITDISMPAFIFFAGIALVLIISFINPLFLFEI